MSERARKIEAALHRGHVQKEMVALAAYLNDIDAASALCQNLRVNADPVDLVSGLQPWGRMVCIRAALAAVSHAGRSLGATQVLPFEFSVAINGLITAITLWLPYSNHDRARQMLLPYQQNFERNVQHPPPSGNDTDAAFHLIMAILHLFGAIGPSDCSYNVSDREAAEFSAAAVKSSREVIEGKPRRVGELTLEEVVRKDMLRWLDTELPKELGRQ